MFIGFDPLYFVFAGPAILFALWAQWRVKSTYKQGDEIGANLSGAAAARHILDAAGLQNVGIEQAEGFLSDHYDPLAKVLRLSPGVYSNRSASAVGIAAHEAGHAIQDATNYAPLVVRNAAVPMASVGGNLSGILIFAGMLMTAFRFTSFGPTIFALGILGYGAVLLFQLVNLPVEFDASNRAKKLVNEMGIVDGEGGAAVKKVLDAAGWTYVAATLTTLLTLMYYIFRFTMMTQSSDD